jgi:hypothetical protein
MMRALTITIPSFLLAPTQVGERVGARGCRPRKDWLTSSRADVPPHPALSPAEAGARNVMGGCSC